MKEKREVEERQKKLEKIQKSKEKVTKLLPIMNKNLTKYVLFNVFAKLKTLPKRKVKTAVDKKNEPQKQTYMTNKPPQDLSDSILNESVVVSNEEVYQRKVSNTA